MDYKYVIEWYIPKYFYQNKVGTKNINPIGKTLEKSAIIFLLILKLNILRLDYWNEIWSYALRFHSVIQSEHF